ncbi:MAG: lactate utilization protein [Thermodesulfobacteriota bacterium]
MDEIRKWFWEVRVDEAVKNLVKHGFEANKASDRLSAVDEIMKRIPPERTVGTGGSVTLREIGILDRLRKQGNLIYDHWTKGMGKEDSLRMRRLQQSSDVFLTSANAVTLSGEIVSIDGFGNRISSMTFGPKEVIIVAGQNKIVRDVGEGVNRIKTWAAPMNAKRFGADTPCARLGRCTDCDSAERICRGILIMERRPFATPTLVVIVMEDLGY